MIDQLWWGPCTHLSYTPEMEKEVLDFFELTKDPAITVLHATYLPQAWAAQGRLPEFRECWEASGLTAGTKSLEFSTWEIFATAMGYNQMMFDNLDWIIKATKAQDIRRAKAEGKRAAFINTQLVSGILPNFIQLLTPAYNFGLRMIQLTYNTDNLIGGGCADRTDSGISLYGTKVLERMNQLGILVDIGHCGKQTTLDACELSRAPVIASHSAAQEVYYHVRAKTDEELKAIADTGGVIGIYNMPFFIAPPPEKGRKVGMNEWLNQIDYVADLVGWEHVAIGSDWPMPMPVSILENIFLPASLSVGHRMEDRVDELLTFLDGFEDYRDFPNITRGLVKRGYRDEQIKGILGENFLRVFEQVCG